MYCRNGETETVSKSTSIDIDNPLTSPTSNCYPDCWSYDQFIRFKKEYDWLCCRDKMLGCTLCKNISSINCNRTQGMCVSSEWAECQVSCYGSTVAKRQVSLRKKIYIHRNSEYHKYAQIVVNDKKANHLPSVVENQQKHLYGTTIRVFRTAYKQIMLNRPFLDFETEIELQVLNGCDMGRILHSNVACGNIVRHICDQMRHAVCNVIVANNYKFSVLIDESTTISHLSTMIVYVRTSFDGIKPVTIFLDLVELDNANAKSIVESLLTCLNRHGFSDEFLSDNFIGIATDGASVMLGRKNGVCKLLSERYPNIISWHCLAHRLELGVHDTVSEVNGINHFKIFLDKLYCVYSASPKNQKELASCASELDVQLLRIGKVLDTRWVASSVRTVKAVWESYLALYQHFKNASADNQRDSRERATYSGLAEKLSSEAFVNNLAIMYDALQELSELSLEFQKKCMTLISAHKAIGRQLVVFEAMCEKSGPHLKQVDEILSAAEGQRVFQGVKLHKGRKCDVAIKRGQFFASLTANLKNRLLSVQSSNVSTETSGKSSEYEDLIKPLKVLYPENWQFVPYDKNALYGEEEVASLAKRFKVNLRESVRAFREYRECGGKVVPSDLKPLMLAVDTIPVSTADCEREFSQMNLTITSSRNSLAIKTASCILFAKLVGPPLACFDPSPYVKSWLSQGRHSADCTKSKVSKKDDNTSHELFSLWQQL